MIHFGATSDIVLGTNRALSRACDFTALAAEDIEPAALAFEPNRALTLTNMGDIVHYCRRVRDGSLLV